MHVETDDTGGPFNKSRLINLAMAQHAGHVCVITDADAFICDWTLREAIRLAGTGIKMILPHNSVCRMTREQSRRVLGWKPSDPVPGKLYRNQRTRGCPGGLWVVHADLFDRHRMDERFEGWGLRGHRNPQAHPLAAAAGTAVSHLACQGVKGAV